MMIIMMMLMMNDEDYGNGCGDRDGSLKAPQIIRQALRGL